MARSSTTFEKGKTGNPKGRPKAEGDVRAAIQTKGPELVNKLLAIALDDKHPEQVRAIMAALDRGYGKPAQELTHHVDNQFALASEAERDAANSRLLGDMRTALGNGNGNAA